MEPTKKQLEELDKKLEYEKCYAIYICKSCGKEIYGMDACGDHASKEHHYEFINKKTKLILGIV